jgi:hypothetical protein
MRVRYPWVPIPVGKIAILICCHGSYLVLQSYWCVPCGFCWWVYPLVPYEHSLLIRILLLSSLVLVLMLRIASLSTSSVTFLRQRMCWWLLLLLCLTFELRLFPLPPINIKPFAALQGGIPLSVFLIVLLITLHLLGCFCYILLASWMQQNDSAVCWVCFSQI